ncbi:MAG TPA: PhnD/SsuA/transferrin family substrate-binding protein [Arenimonas sp.]|uniref:phosphate/phosphite/phosphonate ABC transporter substrate-binding protein n=1 Tax=Arenimonas sp. TaxID=1872635 RepID=UPI002C0F6C1C|nr:PhnD/SsuA/transferrin family substrate-binding protein [Arenimonas sp.]HMB57329.1 PhnD/SsuA/transferrin family substrate-binding protein [Arenimonas sp.]
MKTLPLAFLGAMIALALVRPAAAADYTITVEPNYPPAQAQEVYKPLLDYLGKATGQHFILKTSANYHVYWRDMRAATKTDFAFEEAHFTDYRINRQGFTPLVRVSDPTRFTLLANADVAAKGANYLVGRRIVSMSAPSMGYLLLGELYKNPISQPEIQSASASWKDGVEMIFADETDAAMVPGYIATTYPNLVPVATSRDFMGRALSAAPSVPADVRKKVTDAMLRLHKDNSLYEVINEIGATQFVPATAADYAGNERLLRGVFGYQPIPGKNAPPPAAAAPPPPPVGLEVKAVKGKGGR